CPRAPRRPSLASDEQDRPASAPMFEGVRDLLSVAFTSRVTNWYTARVKRLMLEDRIFTAMNPDHLRSVLRSLGEGRPITTMRIGYLLNGRGYHGPVGRELQKWGLDFRVGEVVAHVIVDSDRQLKQIMMAKVYLVPGKVKNPLTGGTKQGLYGWSTPLRRYYWVEEPGKWHGWNIQADPSH
ncbi:MAG TPA: hypothetical protein VF765_30910, partial [Polyangiaceae bacterium]